MHACMVTRRCKPPGTLIAAAGSAYKAGHPSNQLLPMLSLLRALLVVLAQLGTTKEQLFSTRSKLRELDVEKGSLKAELDTVSDIWIDSCVVLLHACSMSTVQCHQ